MSTPPLDSVPPRERPSLDFAAHAPGEMPWEMLDAIAAPLWITDQQYRWIFLNAACTLLVGSDRSALLGQRQMDVLPLGVSQEVMAAGQRAMASGEAQPFAVEMTDAAGDYRRLTATAWRFFAPNGELRLMVSLQDIAPLHQVEQTLQRQSERERLLGAIAQHLLQFLNSEDLLQTTVNEVRRFLRTDRVLFYSVEPDYRGVVAESARSTMAGSMMPQTDLSFTTADLVRYRQGEIDIVDDVATAHLPAADLARLELAQVKACLIMPIVQAESLYGLVCALNGGPRPWATWEIETLRDVATQMAGAIKQARLYNQVQRLNTDLEQQVAQRTEELQTALEFEATLKRITDRVRDSLDVNQIMLTAVKELTEALEVKGSNTSLYDLEQGTSTIYYEYNSSSPSYQGRVAQMEAFPEVYHQLLDGQYFQFCSVEPNPVRGYVAMLACPIVDDRGVLGDLWLINGRDYGFNDIEIRLVQQVANQCAIAIRQARLYQAAQSQVAELERLNTLKDDFLSTVSHELRTPVTSMRVALQLLGVTLNQEFDLTADLQKPRAEQTRIGRYFSILQEECEREISLINDLLDLQRLDVGNHPIQPEPILLDTWLANWIDSFVTRAKSRDQTLRLVVAPAMPVLYTDLASLERVLAELLNNACKYTPPGEHITLDVSAHPNAPGEQVVIALTNTGVTIPVEEMPRIFDKFYRVPSADPWKQGGTGLGLALVKKLVGHLGGDVEVTSEGNQTCFTITLPTQLALAR
ncbi:GAF domain-containing protein [Nodosilinea sp. LEGE 06152]|uniref:GAF domain-containing sensor histidine kinase n=1 Tax=Nodosilinea sp. LEGE 06152 TaxID=2777966 RepID=UPI0018810B5F|nr:GAF domain-containing protein [Nodosilinea sp. LEGE 06152]MBE9158752.1 GAF domain-containing protein [Nodosilinea sp. LEGE 06152]